MNEAKAFLQDSTKTIQSLNTALATNLLKRAVHTVKGSTSLFGLLDFASRLHAFEDQLASLADGEMLQTELEKIRKHWAELSFELSEGLSVVPDASVVLSRDGVRSALVLLAKLMEARTPFDESVTLEALQVSTSLLKPL